ncbi:MAG: type II secretion system protein GspM [Pseudomonadota bacterium]
MALAALEVARSRFKALEPRDRVALLSLGVFFGLLLLYFGVWVPANTFFAERQANRDQQLRLVQYMRSTEQEARAAAAEGGNTVNGQNLLTEVSRSAQQFGISPNRLQPEGSDGVSVWFDGVAFNDLIRWLEAQSRQGVAVRQLSIDRNAVSGTVNARIVLRS